MTTAFHVQRPEADPVLVVGGGPVGLTAAAVLANRGVDVHVVEASPEPRTDWRASTFHAATLELLDQVGVVEQMHAEGLPVPRYQYRDRRDGLVAEFDFGVLADETRYPYRLQLNQQRLVGILLARLSQRDNVEVSFGTRLVDFEQDDQGVKATLVDESGEFRRSASFLLGADGAASTVRRVLGVGFDGLTYPQRFMIVSVDEEFDQLIPGLSHVAYVADPDEWLFFLRTPESWRVVLPVAEDESDDAAQDPDNIQRKLRAVAPADYHIIDRQLYGVHQRVADRFRVGRVLLLGDAAHINSPLGGMGLNSGIHDAVDAGIRLARIWYSGETDMEAELTTYEERRRTVAVEYVRADTHRNTVMMSERDDEARRRNRSAMAATAEDPERAREWLMRASLLAAVRSQGVGERPRTDG